jgi:hypothetical protein
LNKIALVFSALGSEIDYSVKEGETKYFISLVYYGEASLASSKTGETQKLQICFEICFQICFETRLGSKCISSLSLSVIYKLILFY